MADSKTDYSIYHALMEFAKSDKPFTTAGLRKNLYFNESSDESRRLHVVIQARKKDKIIEVVSQERKRHQHLRIDVKRMEDLRIIMDAAFQKSRNNGASLTLTTTTATPMRVRYLEDRVDKSEQKLKKVETDLAALKQEIHQLVKAWS